MGEVVALFSADRDAAKDAHKLNGLNPDHGLLIGEATPDEVRASNERVSLMTAAIRALEDAIRNERSFSRLHRLPLQDEHVQGAERAALAEARAKVSEARWSLSLLPDAWRPDREGPAA